MGLLPELNDDATTEILLRITPDEPANLFRASVVCKLWHRIISDPNFSRRYRVIHRAPLLLGFFYNQDFPETNSAIDFPAPFSRFVPTTAASPLPHVVAANGYYCHVSRALDCRHGRVLFEKADSRGFAVWDPITNDWTDLPPVPGITYESYSAVVLCYVAGCDHSECCGGRFRVVCIGCNTKQTIYACVYSSEVRAWQEPVSGSTFCWRFYLKRPTVLRDGIYCTVRGNIDQILKYNLVKRHFSWIAMPRLYKREPMLMQNEDGTLGLAGVRGSTLDLWSIRLNKPTKGGNARCGQWKQIKHRKILRVDNKQCVEPNLIGFAEGVGVFFMRTNAGVFMLELKSRRVMKVTNPSFNCPSIVPFMSFFTPAGRAS